jgi:serine phosphatase RsbU (regulator of sigma subunit)
MTHLELRAGGPQRRVPLGDEPVVIGRQRDNGFVLDLESVSRRHARLAPRDGAWAIEDLGSRNGTLVNGARIEAPTVLRDGDRITICDAEIVFRDAAAAPAPGHTLQVTLIDGGAGAGGMRSVISASSIAARACEVRPEDALRAVREVTRLLTREIALDELLARVLDAVFDIYPQADRGVVMLLEEGELVPVASKARSGRGGELRVSRTVLREAIERKQAILSTNAADDAQFEASQSLLSMPIHSLMCVPLLDQADIALGVIELHAESQSARFTEDCLDLLLSVASAAAIAIVNTRLREQVVEQERLERDLEHARAVQKSFLPARIPAADGWEFFAHYEAAYSVGGDYYGFIELPDGKLAIGIADVSGKGMSAALLMARLSSDVRFSLLQDHDPAAALASVNGSLAESGLDDRFVTMLLMVLDPANGRLLAANAGHQPPFLRRSDGTVEEVRGAKIGLPLNVSDDPRLQAVTIAIDLEPGSMLLAYTDGVSEAAAPGGALFGDDRVREAFAAAAGGARAFGDELLGAVRAFSGTAPQSDDRTIVCLQRKAVAK